MGAQATAFLEYEKANRPPPRGRAGPRRWHSWLLVPDESRRELQVPAVLERAPAEVQRSYMTHLRLLSQSVVTCLNFACPNAAV